MPAATIRAVLITLAVAPLMAQPVCPAPGFVGRGVEARAIGTPAVLHWILPSLPPENDVSIDDADAKTALMAAFAKVKAEAKDIVLETGSPLSLGPRVQRQLPAGSTFLIVGPSVAPDVTHKPTAVASPADVCVRVSLRLPGVVPIESLEIHVATAASKAPTMPGRTIEPVNLREFD